MRRLSSLLNKEFIVLVRDKGGLLVTFLMPLAILLVVTLVQDGAFKKATLLTLNTGLVDEDHSDLSAKLSNDISSLEGLKLLRQDAQGVPFNRSTAAKALRDGTLQAWLLLPSGLQAQGLATSKEWARRGLPAPDAPEQSNAEKSSAAPLATPALPPAPALAAYFDSGVSSPHRKLTLLALERTAQGREFELLMKAWSHRLQQALSPATDSGSEADASADSSPVAAQAEEEAPLPLPDPEYHPHTLFSVTAPASSTQATASNAAHQPESAGLLPDMSRFNVPAYSVFAVFFIVIPVSTCLIRERRDGTLTRLLTMPVRPSALIGAKFLLYLAVALAQFALLYVAGRFLLPALGASAFNPSAPLALVLFMIVCTAIAAVGLALAVASTATSHEQAGMTGAALVVVFAALGGVMVPVFYMPPLMQTLSALTPLNWAVTSFQDVFSRGAVLQDVALRQGLLLLLGFTSTAWAWSRLFRRA